jgi:cell division protein ZapB
MESNSKTYTESDLMQLESQIDALIDTVNQLKQENTSLRHQQDNLMSERAQLIEKTELARTRVEAMITRLRSLELSS